MDTPSNHNYMDFNFMSICKAIEVLSTRCDSISIPIKHISAYDLIADVGGKISRIKVLRTECKTSSGSYIANLRSGALKDDFSQCSCEFVFVDTPDGQYFIPAIEILVKRAITLTKFKRFLLSP